MNPIREVATEAFYSSRIQRPVLPRSNRLAPVDPGLTLIKPIEPWDSLDDHASQVTRDTVKSSAVMNSRGPSLLERRKREVASSTFRAQIMKRLKLDVDDNATVVADDSYSLPPSPTSTVCVLDVDEPSQDHVTDVRRHVFRPSNNLLQPRRNGLDDRPRLKLPPRPPPVPNPPKEVARFSGVVPRKAQSQVLGDSCVQGRPAPGVRAVVQKQKTSANTKSVQKQQQTSKSGFDWRNWGSK